MPQDVKASVIISTFNQPKWLDLVLYSYSIQSEQNFEIIIADDGSDEETKKVIEAFIKTSNLNVLHIWQKNEGFRKTEILNKAIVASKSDYLIFTDGDCLPRKDFVETHLNMQKKSCALSSGYFKLSETISKQISKDTIACQDCFDKKWLVKNGQPISFKFNKLSRSVFKTNLLNRFTTTKATFNGMNVSCFKSDIMAVNGFDERMRYGGEDREVGERMMNNGVKFRQVRYSVICVHLHHDRPYKNEAEIAQNQAIRRATKKDKSVFTAFGINKKPKL